MTDQQLPENLEDDALTQNTESAPEDQEVLVSEVTGLAGLSGNVGAEAAQHDHLEKIARAAEADEAAAERWDEPQQSAAVSHHTTKDEAALNDLNLAIAAHPDSAANYVFRGELLLKMKEYAAAEADFQHAVDMASDEVIRGRWGITSQTVQDRAYAGLRDARKKQGF